MIQGNFAGTATQRTNYNQTDPSKSDYLVGREAIARHISGIHYQPFGTKNSSSDVTDFNGLTDLGCYWIQTAGMANSPFDSAEANYGFLEVICVNGSSILQIFTKYSTNGIAGIYERDNVQVGWKDWKRVDALNKQDTITGLTPGMVMICNANGKIVASTVISTTMLGYLKNVTSDIQNQLDDKAKSTHNHAASDLNRGTLSTDILPTIPITKGGTGATTAAAALVKLGITATATELNKLDGLTASTAELNYVKGVTSPIQTQLNGMHKYHGSFTGDIDATDLNGVYWLKSGDYTGTVPSDMPTYAYLEATAVHQKLIYYSNASITKIYERYYTNGQWYNWKRTDSLGKQDAITGLTASRVLICDASGKIATLDEITATELVYLNGVNANIQNQLNNKAPAGYGLGGNSTSKTVTAIDANGWYITNSGTPDGNFWYCHASATNTANDILINAWNLEGTLNAKRKKRSGIWDDWEYVNPPMTLGVEYRTTKRHKGKVVYVMLISAGTLPNKTYKDVSHGKSATELVDFRVMALRDGWTSQLPLANSSGIVTVTAEHKDYYVRIYSTNTDSSAYTGLVYVEYTKD